MEDISLFVLDLVQNSIAANAKLINIGIAECKMDNQITISIKDDGKGMDDFILSRVTDPFYTTRTTRKVGLGIPMAKAAAQGCGGSFEISSCKSKGTQITMIFKTDHLDCPPFGKMEETMAALIAVNTEIDFVYNHMVNDGIYEFDTRVIKKELDGVPINVFEVIEWISLHVKDGINEINGGMAS